MSKFEEKTVAVDKSGMSEDRVAPEKRNDLPPASISSTGSIGEGLTMNDLSISSIVSVENGQPCTTSLKVAEVFEKQHRHVMEAIRTLDIPDEYRQSNFRQTVYERPNPSGGKPIPTPMYLITRDGFTLLAMGFTGKKAMQFKLAYIEAFNAMEKAIKEARIGMIPEEYAIARSEQLIRENERLRYQYEFARNFLPLGNPGDINKNGEAKTSFRRGYYCAGKGRSITALVERANQPGLFDEIELRQIGTGAAR